MLYYDKTDLSEGIGDDKSNSSRECMVCHNCFLVMGFKFQDSFCIGCHDLAMLCLNISDILVITVNTADYCCISYDISRSEAIHLLKNYMLGDRVYI